MQKQANRGQLWKGVQNIFLNENDVIVKILYCFNLSEVLKDTLLFIKPKVFDKLECLFLKAFSG